MTTTRSARFWRHLASAGAVLALLAALPAAQQLAPASRAATGAAASRAGFSVERLKRVDALLQRYVDEQRLAGAVALVLRDGQPVYERAVGWSDKEAGRPMAMDTIFRIASQTKAITSAAVLSLVEEGRLGLGDPVSRFMPAFATTTVSVAGPSGAAIVPAKRPITIRDLLTHTAGISYGTEPRVAAAVRGQGSGAGRRARLVHRRQGRADLRHAWSGWPPLPFVAQPGEAWVYGYNTDILGCIVERVTGQSLDEVIRTRITGPLGLKDTQFFLPPAQRDAARRALQQRPRRHDRARAGRRERPGRTTWTVRAAASPAAPACCRPRATTRASSR